MVCASHFLGIATFLCIEIPILSMAALHVTSTAFKHLGLIPLQYTCQGDDINPPLSIEGIPAAAKSLVLIVDDPDAPSGNWDHWIVWNIIPTSAILENSVPGVVGMNDFSHNSWGGPCPPSGLHRYFFKVYALDCMLDLPASSRKRDVLKAMEGHIVAHGELVGLYKKK